MVELIGLEVGAEGGSSDDISGGGSLGTEYGTEVGSSCEMSGGVYC